MGAGEGEHAAERLSEDEARAIIAEARVLQHLSDIVSLADAHMRFVYVSRVVGSRPRSEVVGARILDYMSPETRADFAAAFRLAWDTREPQFVEGTSYDGMWWETRLIPVGEEPAPRYMLCVSIDVTRRKQAENALRDSERRLRDAINVSGLGTWHWDSVRDRQHWDASMLRIFGIPEERAPQSLADFIAYLHVDDRARVVAHIQRALETGRYDEIEHRIVRPSGEVRIISVRASVVFGSDGKAIGTHGGVFDVTDRRALEERLRHAYKMEAIGQLTAGIAHNFNNLLSIMLPNLELTRPYCSEEAQLRLDDIEHAMERAADVVRQLMLFARREISVAKASSDLAAIIRRTVRICVATFDPRVSITSEIEPGLPRVFAAAGEIEQVLLNICINARDALQAAPRADAQILVHASSAPGGRVRVRITDNGQGMDASTRARIFEPFFTTKGVGRGTGLGLASAYAIVTDHHGTIVCESEPEAGTSFVIELPRSYELTDESTPERAELGMPRGSETLLVIDDEPMVRRALAAVLEGAGYRVLAAGDGDEGLATLAETDARVALIVLDRAMPRASGDQVLSRLRQSGNRVPVILLTGHPGVDADELGASVVLLKPPSRGELLRTIRRLIDA